jgi:hypothetical protein
MTSLLAVFAHPGHGSTDPSSWRHYLTEPLHVAVVVLAAIAAVALWRYVLVKERAER